MEFKKILSIRKSDPLWQLYESSFSASEKRDIGLMKTILLKKEYSLLVIYDSDLFIGFISCWHFDNFVFIEHFAVLEKLRNKGYGTKILGEFIFKHPIPVILEVSPQYDSISKWRINFYRKLGFQLNLFPYIQPSYGAGKPPLDLLLMSYPVLLQKQEFEKIRVQIHKLVYGLPFEFKK